MERDFVTLLIEKTKANEIEWGKLQSGMFCCTINDVIFYAEEKEIECVLPTHRRLDIPSTQEDREKLYELISKDFKTDEELLDETYKQLASDNTTKGE